MSGDRSRYGAAHKRARKALLQVYRPGTLCVRCGHPTWYPRDQIDLDHAENGLYLGWSHHSPCQVCGARCNQSAGGIKAQRLRRARSTTKKALSRGRRW